jgi:hypothetical protein
MTPSPFLYGGAGARGKTRAACNTNIIATEKTAAEIHTSHPRFILFLSSVPPYQRSL